MREFVCPKCGTRVHAIATVVTHRCPSAQNKPTNFVEVPKQD